MSFSDIIQTIRNLFNFNNTNTKNQLKRRAEQVPNYSGLAKYRKVNNYFPKTINTPLEEHMDFAHSTFSDQFSKSQGKRRSYKHVPPFAEIEFSDDEDDNVIPINYTETKQPTSLLNIIPQNNIGFNRRPILSEDNYKRSPIICNIPIQIEKEKKSNPPPLLDVKTGGIVTSTRVSPFFSQQKSKHKHLSNGIVDHSPTVGSKNCMENHQTLVNGYEMNDCRNRNGSLSRKHQNSLISQSFSLQDQGEYYNLLSKMAPSLYKSNAKENDKKTLSLLSNRREFLTDNIVSSSGKRQKPQIKAVVDLTADEEDIKEYIDLSDDDIQVITNHIENADYCKSKSLDTSKVKELPYVEPVNSLKQQLNLQPKLQSKWLDDFKGKYTEKSLLRNKQILEEEEMVQKCSAETARQEKLLHERLKNVVLDTEPIILDESDSEEEVEFPEFTADDIETFKTAVYKGPADEVLVSKFNMNITRRDINTLVGDSWLNDEVINFYMNLIMERGEQRSTEGYPKVYAMNTFFIPRLMQSGYSGVRRWTRKVDIFQYDVIPVPVHVGGVHWCMAIIHLQNRTIKYYDSMGTPNPKVLNALEQYLKEEAYDKKKLSLDTSGFVKESVGDVPRQMNGSDCGVFSCMFAEYICRNKEITFTQQHMRYFRQKMIIEIVNGKLML